jgi:hypothetical protein
VLQAEARLAAWRALLRAKGSGEHAVRRAVRVTDGISTGRVA